MCIRDSFHIAPLQHMEIMVKGKGQIGLSASKVNDPEGGVFIGRKKRKNILNDFKETVNLSKFRVVFLKNFSFFIHYAQTYEERAGCAVRYKIVLVVIMRKTFLF